MEFASMLVEAAECCLLVTGEMVSVLTSACAVLRDKMRSALSGLESSTAWSLARACALRSGIQHAQQLYVFTHTCAI